MTTSHDQDTTTDTDNVQDATASSASVRKRSLIATLKGLALTLLILTVLWVTLRYILTPLVLDDKKMENPMVEAQLEDRLSILEDKVAALEIRPEGIATPPDISAFEARIVALENNKMTPPSESNVNDEEPTANSAHPLPHHSIPNEEIESLKQEINDLKQENHLYLRSIILISQLQDAIRNGRPFDKELSVLATLRPDLKPVIAPIAPQAALGIASLESLMQHFESSIHPALSGDNQENSFSANLQSLIKIRKIGEDQQGNDDEAILARAESAIQKGNVARALQEVNALSTQAAPQFSHWKKQASYYLQAQSILDKLQLAIAARETP